MTRSGAEANSGGERDRLVAAKGRHVALVIACSIGAWIAVNLVLAPATGMPGRMALLFDLAALLALVYAGFRIRELWNLRSEGRG